MSDIVLRSKAPHAPEFSYPPGTGSSKFEDSEADQPAQVTPIIFDNVYERMERSETERTCSQYSASNVSESPEAIHALPPVDAGYAWVFLIAAFFVELLAFGYTFSIGIFHEYWSSTLFPGEENALILTLAATVQSGLMFISAILITPMYTRYPHTRAPMQYAGCLISAFGIFISGFATKPWHLVVTSGLMYPIGGSMVYLPSATLLFDWFQQRRGLANGIMYSGAGLGGACFPLIMQTLLDKYSYRAATTSLALGYGLFACIAVHFIKPRIPVTRRAGTVDGRVESRRNRISLGFFRQSAFWAFGATIVFTSLGSFLPSIYIPAYAVDIGLSKNTGTILLVVMNLSSVMGLLVQGYLSDKWPLKLVVFLSCMGASFTAFFLFGFASNATVLFLFAIFWGFFGLGFTSLWTRLITVVAKNDPLSPPTIFGFFFMVRGVCNVLSGPISNLLLQGAALPDARFGYGAKDYAGLIIFIGATNAVGSVVGTLYREK